MSQKEVLVNKILNVLMDNGLCIDYKTYRAVEIDLQNIQELS